MTLPADDDKNGPRRRKRVKFETSVELEFEGETSAYERTYDVSMNGVFVVTAKPLPTGSKGKFKLILSVGMRHENVMGDFEVVRVASIDDGLSEKGSGPGMAIKFADIEDNSSELLYNVICYNQFP